MYIKHLVTGTVEGLQRSSQGLGKGHFLSLFLRSCGDRLHTWLAGISSSARALGYQVGVQLLALEEGYAVQYPLSGYHRHLTRLPNHREASVVCPGIWLHDHNWVSALAEGE